jgi:Flp pilus assembly protein TadG
MHHHHFAHRYLPKRSHRRGAVSVETAVTIGIAVLFFFASLEFCRVAMIRHTVNNAVYEGARAGTLPGGTVADAVAECNRVMNTIKLRNVNVTVNPSTITSSTTAITVTVTVPLNQNLFSPAIFFKDRNVVNSLEMKMQR